MNRPGSRGGALRLGTAGGARPGSRMQTGMRTGVPQSRAGAEAGYGASLQTDIQVTDRPVTQQGIMGMRTGTAGPGRQVQDRSYFTGLIRQKVGDITDEIAKLKKQCDDSERDTATYAQLERKYEQLIKQVRQAEGQLADYNLAMDKARSSQDPMEIQHYCNQLKEKNSQDMQQVDRIFEQRQQCESAIKEMQGEITKAQTAAEDKINALAPVKLDQYRELLQQNNMLQQQMQTGEKQLAEINAQLQAAEQKAQQDTYREEYERLEKKIRKLQKEKVDLEKEHEASRMDPEQARAMMLEKVKSDKERLDQLDKSLKSVEEENRRNKKVLADLQTDITERKGTGDSQKYDVLFQRDEEMTTFIDQFAETKEKELGDQKRIQETIVALLEHISTGLKRENNMPSEGRVNEMREDLSFKERQLESSQSTKARLEQELTKRNSELDKINTLDDKISVELTSLNEKIESMLGEMGTFAEIDDLRKQASHSKEHLHRMKGKYIRRRDSIKQQVQLLSTKYEQKKNALVENDTAKSMEALEQKLRHYEQNIFHLREYIQTKEHETDFQKMKEDCSRMLDDLNQRVIQQQQTQGLTAY